MTHTTRHPSRSVAAVFAACLVALAACGDDEPDTDAAATEGSGPTTAPPTTAPPTTGPSTVPPAPATTAPPTTSPPPVTVGIAEPATTTPPPASSAPEGSAEPEICAPYLEVSAAFAGEPDPATIGALLDEVDAGAPAEIAEPVGVLTGAARTVLDTGDFTVFEGPEFDAAVTAADTWVFENCEFVTTTEITATEYRYEGQATEYPAGRTAFTLVNDGVEAHELVIIRKNDGVDLTLEELMAVPEDEAESMTAYVAGTFVGTPGARSNLVVDLAPGNYLAVCNIPAGTTVAADGSFTEGTGQPHVMLGMSFEFSVG